MAQQDLPKAIFIMGPTASGKTDLAMQIADHLPVDIISVDSALIYKDMDIGTAKPTADELQQYPHQLVDICDPAESYSVEQFRRDALAAMQASTAAGRVPLLVGGTMLYYRALQYGLSRLPESDSAIRAELEALMQQKGLDYLHQQLNDVDPQAAQRIHSNDPQRTLRALEVWKISGKPMSQLHAEQQGDVMPYQAIKIARSPKARAVLHERINQRFEKMLAQGLLAEVDTLMRRGDLHLDLPSMRCVGYRQTWEYLLGKYGLDDLKEKGKAATRQLAKRQMTWLRSEKELHWLYDDEPNLLQRALQAVRMS